MPPRTPRTKPAAPTDTSTSAKGPGEPASAVTPRRPRAERRHLTVADFCDDLSITRSTFYEWRAKKTAPRCVKLPNGELRIRRADFDAWLESRLEDTA